MSIPDQAAWLEEQISQWRRYLGPRQEDQATDLAELERQLRGQVTALIDAGLATDEAFLVAMKRLGGVDARSREFVRENASRIWGDRGEDSSKADESRGRGRTDGLVALCLAIGAAVLLKAPELFGIRFGEDDSFYMRNASLFVLPLLAGFFVWKRRPGATTVRWLAVAFVAAGLVANLYPFVPRGRTEALAALHLPIALWLVVGFAHAGGRWSESGRRMDFIRFSGELFIYYVLIALGGGVLMGFTGVIFRSIGVDVQSFFGMWVIPCGAMGAVVVASWLVEAKRGMMESMAPVLTRLFTPLFALMLVLFLGALGWTGRGLNIARDLLIAFDLLLVVVLGLLLYSISARDPRTPPGAFDVLQVVLLLSALLADAVVLWAIAARINEFGLSPNRVAALGENLILLVNLGWSAVLQVRFLRGRGSFAALEKWQTDYLPVYGVWAAIVVMVFPPLFGFM